MSRGAQLPIGSRSWDLYDKQLRGKDTKDVQMATISALAGQCKISKSCSLIPAESLTSPAAIPHHEDASAAKGLFIPVPYQREASECYGTG